MPSRVEIHSSRHDAPSNHSQQKSASVSKQSHEVPSRLRQKRMRFTSGDAVDDCVSTSEDATIHRPRRHVNVAGTRQAKGHMKLSSSHPSSPSSPCATTDQLDCVHSRGTVVIDTTINGVEHIEDDNSFSSSVFSEHLVQPELQMVISATPNNSVDKGKSRRNSILSAENLILTDGDNKESDAALVKDMKTMENLLIHADSGISTPTLQTTDDAGSSEGEDENDGKEEALMSATDNMHLPSSIPSSNDLPSVSQPITEEHHNPSESRFTQDGLAILKNSSFSRMLPVVEDKCDFIHDSESPSARSCLLPDSSPNGVISPKNVPVRFDVKNIDPVSVQSLPTAVESSLTPVSTRVMTRSKTAELSKQQPCSPHPCPGPNRESQYTENSPFVSPIHVGVSSTVPQLCTCAKGSDKRRSAPCGAHVTNCGPSPFEGASSWSTTPVSDLSTSNTNKTGSTDGNTCESLGMNKDNADTSAVNPKNFGLCDSHAIASATGTTNGFYPCFHKSRVDLLESESDSPLHKTKDANPMGHVYPLRSRLRREAMRRQLHAMQCAPKAFDELPVEVLFRITHYLSIQDVFRLQVVCRRLKAIVERYLLLVKRINFSNGLPFAFLSEFINDVALKRILSRTPEVTHILGFYPRHIAGSYPSDCHSLGSTRVCSTTSLTYAGIVSAFRICPKLRSVELMDVELMGKLVHYLPRIKFHGMFRNRPDSWDCEYAVPLPSEDCRLPAPMSQSSTIPRSGTESVSKNQSEDNTSHSMASDRSSLGCHTSAFFCSLTAASAAISSTSKCKPYELLSAADIKRLANKCLSTHRSPSHSNFFLHTSPTKSPSHTHSVPLSASVFAHKCAVNLTGFATWFEPVGESPLGQGSPSTVPHFLPTRSISFGSNVVPWYDQANLQPVPTNANATGALDAFRNLAMAPYIQPGLPPIEAELIAAAPIGRDGVPNNQADGAPMAFNNHGPVMALAFGAVFISPHLFGQGALGAAAPVLLGPPPGGAMDGLILANQNPSNRRRVELRPQARHNGAAGPVLPQQQLRWHPDERVPNQAANGAADDGRPRDQHPHGQRFIPRAAQRVPVRQFVRQLYSNQTSLSSHGPWLVSPLPNHSSWIGLPHTITNLTKLDLASVAISAIPRLDNIKYLHLKWVVFTSADPFGNFSATKLQSFVMNNCSGPSRMFRFVRIFSALARAPQLMRLELVGTRFVDGLLGHIIDDALLPGRSFRNLQRLVLSSNRDSTETDVGLLLLAGQSTLNHVALQIAHTRNSLFEALACASAKFPRLENMILGFQDPYQSRLTVSELMSVGIGESSDHLFPICGITDWGISLVFHLCPRLTSLTVRHAPYLSLMRDWKPHAPTLDDSGNDDAVQQQQPPQPAQVNDSRNPPEEDLIADDGAADNGATTGTDPHAPVLRSLTLENCPGLQIESLEHALATGEPFPCLETLVMRDMFMSRFQTECCHFNESSWMEKMNSRFAGTSSETTFNHRLQPENVDWSKASHLLALSDLLNTRRLGFSSICPEGIGLSSSVREVGHLGQTHGLRLTDLPVRPFDLFYSVRTHHYLNSVLELDGSCGPLAVNRSRIASAFFSKNHGTPGPSSTRVTPNRKSNTNVKVDFVSQSTQTCICGLLELQFMWHLSGRCEWPVQSSSSARTENADRPSHASTSVQTGPSTSHASVQSNPNPNTGTSTVPLGGLLAFHPFPVSSQYQDLNRIITTSEWTRFITNSTPYATLSTSTQSFVVVDPGDCPGCVSDQLTVEPNVEPISTARDEIGLSHRPRKWVARDASIDTTELRCYNGPGPLAFTVFQPASAPFSNLTSIHFEKVGISHLVLSGAPHLKNVTLENCPHLQAVLFSPPGDSISADVVPALRRIRVLRCPKFAIYYLLHAVASLYPMHDENISVTYRPFGCYDEQVERALWNRAHHAHVLVSHDYKQHESERAMEEFHSSFDQLFREVINFADMLVRRELLTLNPKPQNLQPARSAFRRSEHGAGWNLVTDIPWIHEVCCSTLRVGDSHRSDQADQFYEVLSEIQTSPTSTKIQRRGIHLHVQYRDVHVVNEPVFPSDVSRGIQTHAGERSSLGNSYLKWGYDELYLVASSPDGDLNAWGDNLDERLVAALPPRKHVRHESILMSSNQRLSSASCLLLAQEEAEPITLPERRSLLEKESFSLETEGTTTNGKGDGVARPNRKRIRSTISDATLHHSAIRVDVAKRVRRHTVIHDSVPSIHSKKRSSAGFDKLQPISTAKRRRSSGLRWSNHDTSSS